jgi:hypothetical protein
MGGVGKTRLALETATRLADEFPDGVWVFELTAVADPAAVPDAVAAVLGVTPAVGQDRELIGGRCVGEPGRVLIAPLLVPAVVTELAGSFDEDGVVLHGRRARVSRRALPAPNPARRSRHRCQAQQELVATAPSPPGQRNASSYPSLGASSRPQHAHAAQHVPRAKPMAARDVTMQGDRSFATAAAYFALGAQ